MVGWSLVVNRYEVRWRWTDEWVEATQQCGWDGDVGWAERVRLGEAEGCVAPLVRYRVLAVRSRRN